MEVIIFDKERREEGENRFHSIWPPICNIISKTLSTNIVNITHISIDIHGTNLTDGREHHIR